MNVIAGLRLKVLERDHNGRDIVESLGHDTIVEAFVYAESSLLMNRNRVPTLDNAGINILSDHVIILIIAFRGFPDRANNCIVIKLFEYAIAAKNDVVIIVPNFKTFDVGGRDNTIWISSVSWIFCFDVTEGS